MWLATLKSKLQKRGGRKRGGRKRGVYRTVKKETQYGMPTKRDLRKRGERNKEGKVNKEQTRNRN